MDTILHVRGPIDKGLRIIVSVSCDSDVVIRSVRIKHIEFRVFGCTIPH